MNCDEARALELFIKDHDTRYLPKAMGDDGAAYVFLKRPETGDELEVRSVEEYGTRYIDGTSPGPTIKEAWAKWLQQR